MMFGTSTSNFSKPPPIIFLSIHLICMAGLLLHCRFAMSSSSCSSLHHSVSFSHLSTERSKNHTLSVLYTSRTTPYLSISPRPSYRKTIYILYPHRLKNSPLLNPILTTPPQLPRLPPPEKPLHRNRPRLRPNLHLHPPTQDRNRPLQHQHPRGPSLLLQPRPTPEPHLALPQLQCHALRGAQDRSWVLCCSGDELHCCVAELLSA